MLFAYDHNSNRVHIDDTKSNEEYYCPYCGETLITRKGDLRQHHFAHKPDHICSDSWVRSGYYDDSTWHKEWQDVFPQVNQEVKLTLGNISHRTDILIDRTVVEFQHSIMSVDSFENRNNFYGNLSYKVIWLFDLSDLKENGQISYVKTTNGLSFKWKNPKKVFNSYDIESGTIDLFFQLTDGETDCIVKVMDVSETGFDHFETSPLMDKKTFLEYVGLKNGICLPPRFNEEQDELYQKFKEQYPIALNNQQERALLTVEGANLLLAVPGSGKTTVLINRLGYMIFCKGIQPENILAITFGKKAAEEMRTRFIDKYGQIGNGIEFRTIHSLGYDIYKEYCSLHNIPPKFVLDDTGRNKLLRDIYGKCNNTKYVYETDRIQLETHITYIKNMMLNDREIKELENREEYKNLLKMYHEYEKELNNKKCMDFDDQLIYAYDILMKDRGIREKRQGKYKYICVDEAQDTSKAQHKIIQILAHGNNIFMVGDEDQSIYGFRGAYPQALLNFRYDYTNPYILRMERNYRSAPVIVNKAQEFISKNKGRYEKNMIAERKIKGNVFFEYMDSREDQYARLLEIAKTVTSETAFLYRDNESAIVLVDLLLRNKVPFRLQNVKVNFFGNRLIETVKAYLSLSINHRDMKSLRDICQKGINSLHLNDTQMWYIEKAADKGQSIYDIYEAIEHQLKFTHHKEKYKARNSFSIFRDTIEKMSSVSSTAEALQVYIKD